MFYASYGDGVSAFESAGGVYKEVFIWGHHSFIPGYADDGGAFIAYGEGEFIGVISPSVFSVIAGAFKDFDSGEQGCAGAVSGTCAWVFSAGEAIFFLCGIIQLQQVRDGNMVAVYCGGRIAEFVAESAGYAHAVFTLIKEECFWHWPGVVSWFVTLQALFNIGRERVLQAMLIELLESAESYA